MVIRRIQSRDSHHLRAVARDAAVAHQLPDPPSLSEYTTLLWLWSKRGQAARVITCGLVWYVCC